MAYNLNKDWVFYHDENQGIRWAYKLLSYDRESNTNTYSISCYFTSGVIAAPSTSKPWSMKFYSSYAFKLNGEQAEGNSIKSIIVEGSSMQRKKAPAGFPDTSSYYYWILDNVTLEISALPNSAYPSTTLPFGIQVGNDSWITTSSGSQFYIPYDSNIRVEFVQDSYPSIAQFYFDTATGVVTWKFGSKPQPLDNTKSCYVTVQTYHEKDSAENYEKTYVLTNRQVPDEVWNAPDADGFYTYEFTVTGEERQAIWDLINAGYYTNKYSGNIYSIRLWYESLTHFYLADGTFEYSAVNTGGRSYKLFEFAGNPPTVDGEVYDVNEKTLALTGNRDTLIRYHSTAHFTITGEAVDGATISQLSVTNTGGIIAGSEGDFTRVESNIFHLDAIDSRGAFARKTIEKGWIEYVKLTADIKSNEVSADGYASITISGNYYGGSFGAQDNSLTLSVRYKTGSGEYGDWVSITPTIGGSNTYEHTINLEGLDYMETYTFQARAQDKLEDILSAEKVFTTIPVFDWGHDDFNFNVPVSIQGKRMGENTILWNGNSTMIATDRAELSEPISAQMNGIVLVFSAASGDVSWNMQYVPKVMVNLLNGGGMAFMMAPNAAMGKFGAKYLYISDDVIEGDVSNETAGTGASAIKFTNADFVLRYVIGV